MTFGPEPVNRSDETWTFKATKKHPWTPRNVKIERPYSRKAYNSKLKGKPWAIFRSQHIKDQCQVRGCGSERLLHLHHKTYENWPKNLPEDVVTVCQMHHEVIHEFERAIHARSLNFNRFRGKPKPNEILGKATDSVLLGKPIPRIITKKSAKTKTKTKTKTKPNPRPKPKPSTPKPRPPKPKPEPKPPKPEIPSTELPTPPRESKPESILVQKKTGSRQRNRGKNKAKRRARERAETRIQNARRDLVRLDPSDRERDQAILNIRQWLFVHEDYEGVILSPGRLSERVTKVKEQLDQPDADGNDLP